MKKLYHFIYNKWINPFKRNKKHNRSFHNWFGELDDAQHYVSFHRLHQLQITNLKSRVKNNEIQFIVTLQRPGLLIGKGGKDLNKLETDLSIMLEKPVKIFIKECSLWNWNKY